MGEVTISSGKLWAGLATVCSALALMAVLVWHERDTRIERDVESIQAERARTLQKYLDTKEAEQKAAREKPDVAKSREEFFSQLVERLERLEDSRQ